MEIDTPAAAAPQSAEELALSHFARYTLDLLSMWPAVRLALANGNGFDDSKSALASQIVDTFFSAASSGGAAGGAAVPEGSTSTYEHGVKLPGVDEVEEVLKWSYGQEFDVDLEDGSEVQVTQDLIGLWREALGRVRGEQAAGGEGAGEDGPMAKRFREGAAKANKEEFRFEVDRGQGGEDGSSSEDDEGEEGSDEEMEGEQQEQQASAVPTRQEPVVDEDGFETVQPKKKGGRR